MRPNYKIWLMLAFWGLGGAAMAQDSLKTITTPVSILPGHSDDIEVLVSSPDGSWIASGGWDKTIVIYKNDSLTTKETVFTGHSAVISALTFSKDGKYLLSAAGDYSVLMWDMTTKAAYRTLSELRKPILSMAISPDNRFVLVSYKDGDLVIHDLTKTPTKLRVINTGRNINTMTFVGTGKAFFAGLDGGEIRMYNAAGQLMKTITGHTDAVQSIVIGPDNKTIYSGSKDKTIRAWDIATTKESYQLKGHTWSVNTVQVSADNRYLLSASSDGTSKIWSLDSKTVLESLEGYGFNVKAAVWSPNNAYVYNASLMKTDPVYGVRKWATGLSFELPKKPGAGVAKPGTPANGKPAPGQAKPGTPGAKPATPAGGKPAGTPTAPKKK